ncbi:MAG: hypothetical protein Kow0059_18220 [Candidatus Sumerlaeia bacterium]
MNYRSTPLLASLFVFSACVLALEVAQMKLFAFSLQFFVIHIVLGIVLMGFGISGTFFSLSRRLKSPETLARTACWSLLAFPASIVLTTWYFCWIAPRVADVFHHNPHYLLPNLITLLSVLTIPYFFAGLALAAVFTLMIGRIGLTYWFNLAGSAIGCLIVFPLLRGLGMEMVLMVVCLAAFASSLLMWRAFSESGVWRDEKQRRVFVALSSLVGLLLLGGLIAGPGVFRFPPDANDQFAIIKRELEKREGHPITPKRLFAQWDPAGKIEVYEFPGTHLTLDEPIPILWYCQDSGAGSILFNFGPDFQKGARFFNHTIYGLPYTLLNRPKVLVIGLGGGIDIQTALFFGAEHVTGIELNAAAVEAVRGPFSDFTGGIYHRPDVQIHTIDGRTFIWRNREKFDLIQMTGADTKQFWASNAMALNINYLYTVESFDDYLDSLAPNGVLSITRFTYDLMRLASIAVETLRRRGVEHPERHIAVIFQGAWGNILIKNEPFTADQLAALRARIQTHNSNPDQWVRLTWFDVMGFSFNTPLVPEYLPDDLNRPDDEAVPYFNREFFAAVSDRREREFLDALPHNFYPTTDDNPFFFRQMRFSEIFAPQGLYVKIYIYFILFVLVLAGLFCLYPLYRFKRRHLRTRGAPWLLLYFFCLGVGFMYLEIGLMQNIARFLGNPGYSVSVILFAILLFSGVGSYWSGRFGGKWAVIRAAVLALAVYMTVLDLALRPILNQFIVNSLTLRALVVIVLLAPLSVAMGMLFPSGLSLLQGEGGKFIPWAVGVNGFASVLGSLTYILVVMALGFKISLLIGVGIYLLALVSIAQFVRSAPLSPSS